MLAMDLRNPRRKGKDHRLLRAYTSWSFDAARRRKAKADGVPLAAVKHLDGRAKAVGAALRELEGWFAGLGEVGQAQARDRMRAEMAEGGEG